MATGKGARVSPINSNNQTKEGNSSAEDEKQLLEDKLLVCSHWFLLEHELAEAIEKGNYSLIPAAKKRVEFLSHVVKPDLLKEGLLGEEDALWTIHQFLHNNGWWEKARNLKCELPNALNTAEHDDLMLSFIFAHERSVKQATQVEGAAENHIPFSTEPQTSN
ncbi:hypothetical protein ACET3Z_022249 [Daucus carota]